MTVADTSRNLLLQVSTGAGWYLVRVRDLTRGTTHDYRELAEVMQLLRELTSTADSDAEDSQPLTTTRTGPDTSQ